MNTGTETAQRVARLALVGALLLLGLWVAHGFIAALLWAVVLTIAVDPLHLKLRSWLHGSHRIVIPLIITLLAALIVLIPLGFGVGQALREAHDITRLIAEAQAQGVPVPDWVARLPVGSQAVRDWWLTHLARPEDAAEQQRVRHAGDEVDDRHDRADAEPDQHQPVDRAAHRADRLRPHPLAGRAEQPRHGDAALCDQRVAVAQHEEQGEQGEAEHHRAVRDIGADRAGMGEPFAAAQQAQLLGGVLGPAVMAVLVMLWREFLAPAQ